MTKQGVASNYGFDLAPKTWELIRNTRSLSLSSEGRDYYELCKRVIAAGSFRRAVTICSKHQRRKMTA